MRCVFEQSLAALEVVAQPADAGELGQHLGLAFLMRLGFELSPQPAFSRVEIVEIPKPA